MNSITSDLIGLSWLPNLSGNVAKTELLDMSFNEMGARSKYSFIWDTEQRCVYIGDNSECHLRLRVDFIDFSGLCYIYNQSEFKIILDYKSESSFMVMEAWKDLRQIIDSCSSPNSQDVNEANSTRSNCICNAMDWPIPFNESLIGEQYELILREFININEVQSNDARHVQALIRYDVFGNETPDSIKERMSYETRSLAIQSMNSIYLDGFISIYSKQIKSLSKYRTENSLRTRKLKSISQFNNDFARIDNLCLSSRSIRITRWSAIIASVAMCLNVISLIMTNL